MKELQFVRAECYDIVLALFGALDSSINRKKIEKSIGEKKEIDFMDMFFLKFEDIKSLELKS